MKDNITSKEAMLKKIRKALIQKKEAPHPNVENTPLYKENLLALDELFAEQFTAVSGLFVYCKDETDVITNLLHLFEEKNWFQIYCWEKPLLDFFEKFNFPVYEHDQNFEDAEVGITLCETLIARNGSILISNGSEAGRRLSIYPHNHIVIAKRSQLVLDIKDGFNLIHEKYGTYIPTLISNITGPSRTADIEKTLVLGAHGPKNLYVFFIDKD